MRSFSHLHHLLVCTSVALPLICTLLLVPTLKDSSPLLSSLFHHTVASAFVLRSHSHIDLAAPPHHETVLVRPYMTSKTSSIPLAAVTPALTSGVEARVKGQTVFLPRREKNLSEDPASFPQRKYHAWRWRDYKVNYRVEGDDRGTPLLLIHGFGANVNHFLYNIDALAAAGYRVYAIDLLGFGASDKPSLSYTLELFSELLVDFIRDKSRFPGEKWVVGGNSIGGLISMMTAQTLKDDCAAVILLNSAGGLTTVRYEDLPLWGRPLWFLVQNILFSDWLGPRLFDRVRDPTNLKQTLSQVYAVKEAVTPELMETLLGPSRDENAVSVFLRILRGPAGPTPEEVLKDLDVPILALWGRDDPWTPLDRGRHPGTSFPRYNPRVELQVLDGTGHCPMDERPDEVNKAIVEWLGHNEDVQKAEAFNAKTTGPNNRRAGG
ncbi:unnamed protein product [Vitrella brassicaformis CCMP3155]|uniref:AB hydrolase-1 domain-containing protein n=2 Tax=Vitrella brassicaformis TaxID=1169539 RepID=A0A0G4EA00_VITBC|nr:unnamed protein product [Vitrella brassicaformis CCMP3155]|mmetsp:Transcript_41365/g.103240  ORF Transcript_41365/g.103240 Transcript_41365/m.103240 type:complete len:436 (+) Transcript_41365:178-1485(+)|eukprot:CEL92275.1 unnamed protein product [Vitrella brassicaformis CCMP3155]